VDKIKTTFVFSIFFLKIIPFMGTRQATDDNMAHAYYVLHN